MNSLLQKIHNDHKRKITYSRVLTNRMTIIAARLYQDNPDMHLAIICYRLRNDFGFTDWEVANFTGIPGYKLANLRLRMKKLLKSEILKMMVKLNMDKEEDHWRTLPDGHGDPQGWWFDEGYETTKKKRKTKKRRFLFDPYFRLGLESEKGLTNGSV